MKITKRQLRRIIKEEKQKLLREGRDQEQALFDAIDIFVQALNEEMGPEAPAKALWDVVLDQVDNYFYQEFPEA